MPMTICGIHGQQTLLIVCKHLYDDIENGENTFHSQRVTIDDFSERHLCPLCYQAHNKAVESGDESPGQFIETKGVCFACAKGKNFHANAD